MAIKKCTCDHPDQDRIHGEKMRVMNECSTAKTKESGVKKFRCTVCLKEASN